ncbi:MAG TPA: NADH-ubiquinone oxidoreductase-F iron-sulfur binding region domain-containing protein [candidate division Zixibacteria bacterium]|nr:NADH-ubiquinone oxidoreductase-F iron-sulfur binding region domain-containing protein [candidate division Zixibacteria bacterium]
MPTSEQPGRNARLSPQIRILPRGERRLLAHVEELDPDSLASYREHGGYAGLERAVQHLGPEGVIAEIAEARLRGRGGAGYPTADKWRAARAAESSRKIVVANLMGADPTALGDRALAEANPHLILEGLLIAAFATGASEGIVAVRRDWSLVIERMRAAVAEAEAHHLAGYLVMGTDFSCTVSVWEGSGALVAGEESALLAALAGDRGMPVIRPPYPTEVGLWGVPTTVQNAGTLAHAAWIVAHSAEAYATVGTQDAPGTRMVTVYGRVSEPGVVEVALGTPLSDIISLAGGPVGVTKAVVVGGPGGGILSAGELSTPYEYEPLRDLGADMGLGSMLVLDTSTCMVATARFFLDWSSREACGKAVPCRIGTKRLVEAVDRVLAATPRPNDFVMMRDLSRKMRDTALCHLEARAPNPLLTAMDRFPDEFRAHAERGVCLAGACDTQPVPPLAEPLPGLEPATP